MILKTKKLKNDVIFLKPVNFDFSNNNEIIDQIKDYVYSNDFCVNIILDLTEVNFLSSIKIGALISTYHFIKFLNGKTYILVNDIQAKKQIEKLSLNNVTVIYDKKQVYLENIA